MAHERHSIARPVFSRESESFHSPGIVDHEAPGPVGQLPENIRIPARELYRLTVRAGPIEGPLAHDESQIIHLKDALHLELQFAVQRDEPVQRLADTSQPTRQAPRLSGKGGLGLIERQEQLVIPVLIPSITASSTCSGVSVSTPD